MVDDRDNNDNLLEEFGLADEKETGSSSPSIQHEPNKLDIARFARPPLTRRVTPLKARQYVLSMGPTTGKKGDSVTLAVSPQTLFRGEKIIATDTLGGNGTLIRGIFVGSRSQFPESCSSLSTACFAPSALHSGHLLDTCQPGLNITTVVEFLEDCTFDATIFGRIVT